MSLSTRYRPASYASERGICGQATVEAAVLIPTVMLLLAFLTQPACLLYTRMVMRSAATECARVLATAEESDEDAAREFALRRLRAVPEVCVFHVGGRDDWDVSLDYGRAGQSVSVSIRGHLRPLPLLGVSACALGESEGDLVLVEASVTERVRPSWLGGSYDEWQSIWS